MSPSAPVLQRLAAEDEPLEILGRYRFSLGEREIDLTEAIEGTPSAYPL